MKTCDHRYAILTIFKENELHGYELHRLLELQNIKIGTSRLYALLEEMKAEGLLLDRWEKSDSGPKKRIYSLSEKGHQERLETLIRAIDIVHEFYLDYLQNLPNSTNLFTKISKTLSSHVPQNGTIVCLFSTYNSPLDMLLRGLKTELPDSNAYIVTPNPNMHEFPEGWQPLTGRCDDIPLKDGFADLIFIAGYRNEFVEDSCVSEWKRVLHKEGQFSLVTPRTMISDKFEPLSIGGFIESIEHKTPTDAEPTTWPIFKKKIQKIFPSIEQFQAQDIIIITTSE